LSICDEYDFVLSFLNKKGLYEKYKEEYNEIKYSAYKWNYYRIDDEYKKIFLKRWKQEFKE